MKEKEYIEVNYRKLEPGEAEKFWEMMNSLDSETSFMMFEPGERKKNLEELESIITRAKEGTDFLLAAEIDGELVGYLMARRGTFRRTNHAAYIVTGIRKQYRRIGIGTMFFKELDAWARRENLRRLELTVVCRNTMARHLYEKSGFQIEGVKKDSMCIDGVFMDEYYMGKVVCL